MDQPAAGRFRFDTVAGEPREVVHEQHLKLLRLGVL